jgi:hypothetical protein
MTMTLIVIVACFGILLLAKAKGAGPATPPPVVVQTAGTAAEAGFIGPVALVAIFLFLIVLVAVAAALIK